MDIEGSPTSKELFGIVSPDSGSQDLFDDTTGSNITTPVTSNKKRPCFRTPKLNSLESIVRSHTISPLTSTICKSVQGIYCSQERKDCDSKLHGDIWDALKIFRNNDVLTPYNIKNVLNGTSLYRGKVAHLAVLVKSVERISQKDCSLILYDDSGEIKAAVHKRVLDKYGAFLEPGSGLLLRQCTIFSFISIQKYINITLPNIVHIFNSSSLIAPPESVDRHVLEVSEINVQKEENPDTENQTPIISTPNRPPPPRSTRSANQTTPQRYSKTTGQTPLQNHQRGQTPQGQEVPEKKQTPLQAQGNQNQKIPQKEIEPRSRQTPQREQTQRQVVTPQRVWTPNKTRSFQSNTETPQICKTPLPVWNVSGASDLQDEGSYEQEEHRSKKMKVTPSAEKSDPLSPKEQEEISKLLEDIDDSYFDEF